MSELKMKAKMAEESNTAYMQQNMELEEVFMQFRSL